MKEFQGGTAVITGAGSGFGLEMARLGAGQGMNLVLADVEQGPLDAAVSALRGQGAQVLGVHCDVSQANQVEALGAATLEAFGVPSVVFNNAGVGGGGLVWESTLKDWEWMLGVNLMGVVHGVRVFTPMMLDAARRDPAYEGHIVNTASVAGLVPAPNLGVYSVSKHAVVALSETLHHDLSLVTDQVKASVLCPYFVPTGIADSARNRPADLQEDLPPTKSQIISRIMSEQAVSSGQGTAADVAEAVFEGLREGRFYIYSHPQMLDSVRTRMEDVCLGRTPSDPFAAHPEAGRRLRRALRKAS